MVIVDLDWTMSDEQLRALACEMWAVEVGPIVAALPDCSVGRERLREHPQAAPFCQRLVENGILSLFSATAPANESRADLFGAADLYAIANRSWKTTSHGWALEVDVATFVPIWEGLKEVAAQWLK